MGGGEIALLNVARQLRQTQFQPLVLLFDEGPLAERLRTECIETYILPLSRDARTASKDSLGGGSLFRFGVVWSLLAHVVRVAAFIRRARPAIVHTNSLKSDVIGGLAARMAGKPLIWHVRDRIADDYLPPTVARIFRWLCRLVPTFVLANSESTLRTVVKAGRPNAAAVPSGVATTGRIHVIHDGTRDVKFSRNQAFIARDSPRIGLVGRICPWKGQDVFLKAAAQVLKKYPKASFQIIGAALFSEQDCEQSVRRLSSELGLDYAVEFTGFRSDVPDLIQRLDILVHASTLGEPFGQVVIEGMAASKPVVATNGGGIPEIVIDGVTGILVPMKDVDAMAGAICNLLADPGRARRMGAAGYQRVMEHFTIEHTTAKIAAIYDKLLAR